MKSMSFHQYSWNSEVETNWISLIDWHHKTSTTYPCIIGLMYHNESLSIWNLYLYYDYNKIPVANELESSTYAQWLQGVQ